MSLLTGKASDFLKIGVAAAGRGDMDTVRAVLEEKPDWVTMAGSHGRTMLWEAAYRGRIAMVDYLLDRGADIDACGCHFTPLLVDISPYCAAEFRKHREVAARLLKRGARLDVYTAAYLGDTEEVCEYLDREPGLATAEKPQNDPNLRATALHYAVAAGYLDIVSLLLARGADPRPYGDFLVRFCAWRRRPDILERLLDAGLDPSTSEPPRSGVTDPEILRVLRDRGVEWRPDHAEGGWPPIVFQSRGDRGGDAGRVRALIDQGADVNARNHKGQTALHCAAKAGFTDIVALLLSHGAEVDPPDARGETPLASAIRSTVRNADRLREVARILVRNGASPDHEDKRGHSPRRIAARKRDAGDWLDAMTDTGHAGRPGHAVRRGRRSG
ncbi:MAG: ankyrin repeat domain-containing protein [Gammaproteobacteria bacterium]|nr:ankyrin repeat domain-containing protein [Gammaproteobacteria bacterium]